MLLNEYHSKSVKRLMFIMSFNYLTSQIDKYFIYFRGFSQRNIWSYSSRPYPMAMDGISPPQVTPTPFIGESFNYPNYNQDIYLNQ